MTQPIIISVLKALSDETRLKILKKMVHQKGATETIICTKDLDLAQPTLSHHFKVLIDAGVVLETKSGTKKSYKLNQKLLKQVGIDMRKW